MKGLTMNGTTWKTRQEAAAYLRVSTATIDRLARAGDLPKHMIGNRPRFRTADLDKITQSASNPPAA